MASIHLCEHNVRQKYCEYCRSMLVTDPQHCDDCFAAYKVKTDKLKTALQELDGFATRNLERAKKARDAAGLAVSDFIKADARYHEAHRVYMVIVDRVREALS